MAERRGRGAPGPGLPRCGLLVLEVGDRGARLGGLDVDPGGDGLDVLLLRTGAGCPGCRLILNEEVADVVGTVAPALQAPLLVSRELRFVLVFVLVLLRARYAVEGGGGVAVGEADLAADLSPAPPLAGVLMTLGVNLPPTPSDQRLTRPSASSAPSRGWGRWRRRVAGGKGGGVAWCGMATPGRGPRSRPSWPRCTPPNSSLSGRDAPPAQRQNRRGHLALRNHGLSPQRQTPDRPGLELRRLRPGASPPPARGFADLGPEASSGPPPSPGLLCRYADDGPGRHALMGGGPTRRSSGTWRGRGGPK